MLECKSETVQWQFFCLHILLRVDVCQITVPIVKTLSLSESRDVFLKAFKLAGRSQNTIMKLRAAFLISGFMLTISAPAQVTSGLVGWWKLDDASGSMAGDCGPKNYTGLLVNNPTWISGQWNGALQFTPSSSNYVTMGNITELQSAQHVTLAAWFKRSTPTSILTVGKDNPALNGISIRLYSDGNVWFSIESGGDAYSQYALADTAWHHIVMVYDGTQIQSTSRVKAYVDGVAVTLGNAVGTYPAQLPAGTGNFYIGNSPSLTYYSKSGYSDGSVDDVRVYTNSLTSTQVAQLYANGINDVCIGGGVPRDLAQFTTDCYVAQTTLGNGSGTSSNNALSLAWLDTPSNWGTGANQIGPGITVHLCGTLTNHLIISGSGNPSNPVVIRFEPGANLTFGDGLGYGDGAIKAAAVGNIEIDGGFNGFIRCTNNGYGSTNNDNMVGIYTSGCFGSWNIHNLIITNLNVASALATNCWPAGGITMDGAFTNTFIHNNTFRFCGNTITVTPSGGTCSNFQIYSNDIRQMSFAIDLAGSDPHAPQYGFKIWANIIDDWRDYDNCTCCHQDAFIAGPPAETEPIVSSGSAARYNGSGTWTTNLILGGYYTYRTNGPGVWVKLGSLSYTNNIGFRYDSSEVSSVTFFGPPNGLLNFMFSQLIGSTNFGLQFYRNKIGPNLGRTGTAVVYMSADYPAFANTWMIYNNLVLNTTNQGFTRVWDLNEGTYCFNNTVVCLNTNKASFSANIGSTNITLLNNLLYNYNGAVGNVGNRGSGGPGYPWPYITQSDYNNYYGYMNWQNGMTPYKWPPNFSELNYTGLPAGLWLASNAYEQHSSTNKPSVDLSTFAPLSTDNVLVGHGTNLTVLANQLNAPDAKMDFYGNPRPTSGAWTIGAFEKPSSTTRPSAPPGLPLIQPLTNSP